MSRLTSKTDIAIVAIALMSTSCLILGLAGYPLFYQLIAVAIYFIMYLIATQIEGIWTSAIIYSFCISNIAWVLTIKARLDAYIVGNSYNGVTQAMLAICFSLLLYHIICNSPGSTQMFLILMITGILFTRNYTCLYCSYLLLYLFAPLGFKIRRVIGKYMRLIRLFTLPFILISLPLIVYTNMLASCPAYMLLLLAYYQVIYKPRLGLRSENYGKDGV